MEARKTVTMEMNTVILNTVQNYGWEENKILGDIHLNQQTSSCNRKKLFQNYF